MKTKSLIFGIFYTLMTSFVGAQDAAKMETSSTKNLKFAFVQFDNLLKRMPATKKLSTEIERMSNAYQTELSKMAKEGQDKYQNLEAKAATLDPAIRKVLEQEIGEIQQRMQTLQMTAEQEIQKKQNEITPIAESLSKSIKEYGQTHQFSAIFFDMSLIYTGVMEDLTEVIAKQLNLPKDTPVTTPAAASKPVGVPGAAKPAPKK